MKTLVVLLLLVVAVSAQYQVYYNPFMVRAMVMRDRAVAVEKAVVKKRERRDAQVIMKKLKAKVRMLKTADAATPADTKLLKVEEKEVEVPVFYRAPIMPYYTYYV